MRTLITVICLLVCPALAASQQSTDQARSDQIAAAFTKHKNVVSVKRGVTREKYKDVRAEPVVASNVSDYAGRYANQDWGWWIDVRVGADGRIQATGYEAGEEFELRSATIAGALLTATKVYQDGRVEDFEGIFMNRTERANPADTGVTAFGLGIVLANPIEVDGNSFDKVFYRLTR
jgi:hypothetical protein